MFNRDALLQFQPSSATCSSFTYTNLPPPTNHLARNRHPTASLLHFTIFSPAIWILSCKTRNKVWRGRETFQKLQKLYRICVHMYHVPVATAQESLHTPHKSTRQRQLHHVRPQGLHAFADHIFQARIATLAKKRFGLCTRWCAKLCEQCAPSLTVLSLLSSFALAMPWDLDTPIPS